MREIPQQLFVTFTVPADSTTESLQNNHVLKNVLVNAIVSMYDDTAIRVSHIKNLEIALVGTTSARQLLLPRRRMMTLIATAKKDVELKYDLVLADIDAEGVMVKFGGRALAYRDRVFVDAVARELAGATLDILFRAEALTGMITFTTTTTSTTTSTMQAVWTPWQRIVVSAATTQGRLSVVLVAVILAAGAAPQLCLPELAL